MGWKNWMLKATAENDISLKKHQNKKFKKNRFAWYLAFFLVIQWLRAFGRACKSDNMISAAEKERKANSMHNRIEYQKLVYFEHMIN